MLERRRTGYQESSAEEQPQVLWRVQRAEVTAWQLVVGWPVEWSRYVPISHEGHAQRSSNAIQCPYGVTAAAGTTAAG
ncbi:hypothetical protein E2C01_072066 [Portunus trituberculatus]|uniref:Uncharacterized protein n=1 Tax=Portunus trituberculatus TaxID=210409 RepID=A0A5B7I9Q8_PORTR|nr:hypothetical protein [Portunus trituberculatus]